MAVTGIFVDNFTEDEVRAIIDRAKALLLDGKTIMSYGDEGTNVTKEFTLPVDRVLDEARYALKKLDPTTYGRATDSRRAHANFGATSMQL